MKLPYSCLVCLLLLLSCGGKETVKEGGKGQIEDQKSLAIASIYRRNFPQALVDIQIAEEINDEDAEVHLIKGLIFLGLKDYNQAEASFKRSIGINSKYSEARYNLCVLYLKVEKFDLAIEQCSLASSDILYRSRDKAFTSLGVAYFRKGQIEKAMESYNKALQLNPAFVYTHNELGKLYMSTGKHELAIEEFKRAVIGYEFYDEALYNLGVAYLQMGQAREACDAFTRVVEISSWSEYGVNAKNYLKSLCN